MNRLKKIIAFLGLDFLICSSALAVPNATTQEEKSIVTADMLDRVAMIESNFNFRAIGKSGERGAYQIKSGIWEETVDRVMPKNLPVCNWKKFAHDPTISRFVCSEILMGVEKRFIKDYHKKPTRIQLYMAYNMGYIGAKRYAFVHTHMALDAKRLSVLHRAEFLLNK